MPAGNRADDRKSSNDPIFRKDEEGKNLELVRIRAEDA
jgi:hypothetical protein